MPQIIMIASNDCPPCLKAREMYKKEIESGEIIVIDLSSPKAEELILKYNLNKVPSFLSCDGDNCTVVG